MNNNQTVACSECGGMATKMIQHEPVCDSCHKSNAADAINSGICPDCYHYLIESEGCRICLSCGWSACEN